MRMCMLSSVFALLTCVVFTDARSLVLFGDSITDAGGENGFYSYIKSIRPDLASEVVPPPYKDQRFTNADVWAGYVYEKMLMLEPDLEYKNYAMGAAIIHDPNSIPAEWQGFICVAQLGDECFVGNDLQAQIAAYVADSPSVDDTVLVLIGGNTIRVIVDLLVVSGDESLIQPIFNSAAANLSSIAALTLSGHTDVSFISLPPFTLAPATIFAAEAAFVAGGEAAKQQVYQSATFLGNTLNSILQDVAAAVGAKYIDQSAAIIEYADSIMYPPETPTSESLMCFENSDLGLDADGDVDCSAFVFVDGIHPAKGFHKNQANFIYGSLVGCGGSCGANTMCVDDMCVANCQDCDAAIEAARACVALFDPFCATNWDDQCGFEAVEVCGMASECA